MKYMIKLFLVLACSITLIFSSCKKCKQCYLVEAEGTAAEKTTSLGEKCGGELDDIDGKTYTSIDGPTRSYCN